MVISCWQLAVAGYRRLLTVAACCVIRFAALALVRTSVVGMRLWSVALIFRAGAIFSAFLDMFSAVSSAQERRRFRWRQVGAVRLCPLAR